VDCQYVLPILRVFSRKFSVNVMVDHEQKGGKEESEEDRVECVFMRNESQASVVGESDQRSQIL